MPVLVGDVDPKLGVMVWSLLLKPFQVKGVERVVKDDKTDALWQLGHMLQFFVNGKLVFTVCEFRVYALV